MKMKYRWVILGLVLVLAFASSVQSDEEPFTNTIMRPDKETLLKWIADYESAPKAYIDEGLRLSTQLRGSHSLLSYLQYTPAQRNQASCGNCWVWAGTGVTAIALNVQEGISDRLSIQFLDSCYDTGEDYACCGGTLTNFATYYTTATHVIPWSNTNASFQDASRGCADESSLVSCGSVSTSPNYPVASITPQTISTQGISQAEAIANIKNVLNQNKGIFFGFWLADDSDWSNFRAFWDNQEEATTWNPDYSCGTTWVPGEGGGHAVLCVGYNDDDPNNSYWVMLNSWGTAGGGRPNGLFRLDMDMNYSCTLPYYGTSIYSFEWETLAVTFNTEGEVIYVDPSGSCGGNSPCYTTVQAAVNAASTGTTIKIFQGTYSENVVLSTSKQVTLSGGWNSSYTSQSSISFVSSLVRSAGSLIAKRVGVQQ